MTSTATSRRTASSPAPVRSCSAGLAASHAALPASQATQIVGTTATPHRALPGWECRWRDPTIAGSLTSLRPCLRFLALISPSCCLKPLSSFPDWAPRNSSRASLLCADMGRGSLGWFQIHKLACPATVDAPAHEAASAWPARVSVSMTVRRRLAPRASAAAASSGGVAAPPPNTVRRHSRYFMCACRR